VNDGAFIEKELHSQAPVNNFQAATGFIGIKPTTNRGHMVRAILESIVFRVLQLYQALQREVKNCYTCVRLVGYYKNEYICKLHSREQKEHLP
jgi:Glycerol kinase